MLLHQYNKYTLSTLLQLLVFIHAVTSEPQQRGAVEGFLNCGGSVHVCGVLTLESGLGRGNYHHRSPSVHGIWPQTGHFGSSQCVPPTLSSAPPSKLYACYHTRRDEDGAQMDFETHEWIKHGRCAGVKDADDFFTQVCALSAAPLALMKEAASFSEMVASLRHAGFSIYRTDDAHEQVELSVCLTPRGQWKLAAIEDFEKVCGDGGQPSNRPTSAPNGRHGTCLPSKRGPSCKKDEDCKAFDKCLRCAHSGFCTAQPLTETEAQTGLRSEQAEM